MNDIKTRCELRIQYLKNIQGHKTMYYTYIVTNNLEYKESTWQRFLYFIGYKSRLDTPNCFKMMLEGCHEVGTVRVTSSGVTVKIIKC